MTKKATKLLPVQVNNEGADLGTKTADATSLRGSNTSATEYLIRAKDLLDDHINNQDKDEHKISEARKNIETALTLNKKPFLARLLLKWTPLIYIGISGLGQIGIIELYARWHGAQFISPQLYDPLNVQKLSNIGFINTPPTTMDIAAEVLAWSSLGVWAKHTYDKVQKYKITEPDLPNDVGEYIGKMMRNITVAAIVIILLRLSKFSIFDVSLNDFSAVVGISFVLGIFGDETFEILIGIKDRIVESIKS